MQDQNLNVPSGAELVRIYGMDASGKAFLTIRAARNEGNQRVRLFTMGLRLQPNDVIGMRYQDRRARLRVDTVAPEYSTHESFILCSYIECDPILPCSPELPASSKQERRVHARQACDLGASLQTMGGTNTFHARCSDISMGGVMWKSQAPVRLGHG